MGDFKTGAVGSQNYVHPKEETYLLTKKFRFETAHRLAKGYEGKCAHLHGHSWNGEITVQCDKLDDQGMAIDYKDIGIICKNIENELDHKTILYHGDHTLIEALKDVGSDVVTFTENPTSEVLAKWIFNKAKAMIEGVVQKGKVYSVSIEETCASRCVYFG